MWLTVSVLTEVPQDRLNVTEDLSATTGDPALLNRSYDTAIAGRRARSAAAAARSSARRSRVRPAAATTPAADDANQGTSALQDHSSQNNDTSGTGLFASYNSSLPHNVFIEK